MSDKRTLLLLAATCLLAALCIVHAVDCPEGSSPCQEGQPDPCISNPAFCAEQGFHCEVDVCTCSPTCVADAVISATMVAVEQDPVAMATSTLEQPAAVPVLISSGATTATAGDCPDGTAPVNCLVDPCTSVSCGPNQACQSSYCGGCHATCVVVTQAEPVPLVVEVPADSTSTPLASTTATDGPSTADNPAATTTAATTDGSSSAIDSAVPAATATATGTSSTNNNPAAATTAATTTDGSSTTATASDSIDAPLVTTASNSENSTISSVATDSYTPSPCPHDKPLVDCYPDPCLEMTCPLHKTCVTDKCGKCTAKCVTQIHINKWGKCPYNPCARVHCEPSAYKTMCYNDKESCAYKCVALPPPTCQPGFGFNAATKRCQPCKKGYVSDNGSNICAACAVDHYEFGHRTCKPCPMNHTTAGKKGQSKCVKI